MMSENDRADLLFSLMALVALSVAIYVKWKFGL